MNKYLFLLLPFLLAGCYKGEPETLPVNDDIIGTWINPDYGEGTQITFERADALIEGYGITFMENGICIIRRNAGWCGTPPITYGDFEGTWEENDNGTITIVSPGWGDDPFVQEWTLIQVDNETLIIEEAG